MGMASESSTANSLQLTMKRRKAGRFRYSGSRKRTTEERVAGNLARLTIEETEA